LDYKGLKKFISSLLNTPADSLKTLGLPPIGIEEDRAKLLQSQKAAFFFKLERELEKVSIALSSMGLVYLHEYSL
jgi:CDK inhibitor PHO81